MKTHDLVIAVALAGIPACKEKTAARELVRARETTGAARPGDASSSQRPTVAATPSPGARSPSPHAQAGGEGPHGGQVVKTGAGHIELLAEGDGTIHVHLLDKKMAPRSIAGYGALLRIGTTTPRPATHDDFVKLEPDGDHLIGRGPPFADLHPTITLQVTSSKGASETVRFEIDFTDAELRAP